MSSPKLEPADLKKLLAEKNITNGGVPFNDAQVGMFTNIINQVIEAKGLVLPGTAPAASGTTDPNPTIDNSELIKAAGEIKLRDEKITGLEKSLADLNTTHDAALKSHLQESQALKAEITTLKATPATTTAASAVDTSALSAQITDLTASRDQIAKDLAEREKTLGLKNEEIVKLTDTNKGLTTQVESLSGQLTQVTSDLKKAADAPSPVDTPAPAPVAVTPELNGMSTVQVFPDLAKGSILDISSGGKVVTGIVKEISPRPDQNVKLVTVEGDVTVASSTVTKLEVIKKA